MAGKHPQRGPAHGDKPRHDAPERAWSPEPVDDAPRPFRRSAWRWWGGMAACLVLGWVAGVTMVNEPHLLSSALAAAWGNKADKADNPGGAGGGACCTARSQGGDARSLGGGPAVLSGSEQQQGGADQGAGAVAGGCRMPHRMRSRAAVTGGAEWRTVAGTIGLYDGLPGRQQGRRYAAALDNGANASAVFIKIYDTERH
jgi:hypothetical protein